MMHILLKFGCCVAEVDPCNGVNCGHGTCQPSAEDTAHYECVCQQGWTGAHCDQGIVAIE